MLEKVGSFIKEAFQKSLDVGYRSKRERSWQLSLVFFSFVLSVASGYTTFNGLIELIYAPFALAITVGIQGLLFVSAWRIGGVRNEYKFDLNLLTIFLLTMICSIFFSWISIINNLYQSDMRESDELDYAISRGSELLIEFNSDLRNEIEEQSTEVLVSLQGWKSKRDSIINVSYAPLHQRYADAKIEIERLDSIVTKEERSGYGTSRVSGQGIRFDRFRAQRDQYRTDVYLGLETMIDDIQTSADMVKKKFNSLVLSPTTLTVENLNNLLDAYQNYEEDLQTYTGSIIGTESVPQNVVVTITSLSPVNQFLDSRRGRYKFARADSSSTVKDSLRMFIADLRELEFASKIDIKKFNRKISNIGKFGGQNAHPYAVALGGLFRLEPLTWVALLIAIAIDLLVLFCSLLSFPDKSFLEVEKPEDLFPLRNLALEVSFSMNALDHSDSKIPYIKRIAQILAETDAEIYTAAKGYPASVSLDLIKRLNLNQIMGTLVALQLAKVDYENNKLYLRTKLLLWMGEQVLNTKSSLYTQKTASEIFAPAKKEPKEKNLSDEIIDSVAETLKKELDGK